MEAMKMPAKAEVAQYGYGSNGILRECFQGRNANITQEAFLKALLQGGCTDFFTLVIILGN